MKLTFAKSIRNGWSYVTLDGETYVKTDLLQNCERNGCAVVVNPACYDRITSIFERASQQANLLKSRIIDVIHEHNRETAELGKLARENPENLQIQDDHLASVLCCVITPETLSRFVEASGDFVTTMDARFDSMFSQQLARMCRAAGIKWEELPQGSPAHHLTTLLMGSGLQFAGLGDLLSRFQRELEEREQAQNLNTATGQGFTGQEQGFTGRDKTRTGNTIRESVPAGQQ